MSDKNIILKTFQNNNLDIPYKDTYISLDGQDIVLQPKSGESLRLPFAAQFVSMSGNEGSSVFELTFSDGFKLNAKEILSAALENYKENDGVLSVNKLDKEKEQKHDKNNDNDNTDETPPVQVIKEKVVVQEIIEKIIEKGGESDVDNDLYDYLNKKHDFEDSAIYNIKPTPVFFSTSSTAQKNKDAEQTEILNKPNDTSSLINFPDSLKLLQLETIYNASEKKLLAGGGSRTDGSFDAQYGKQLIDMSAYNDGITFDAAIRGISEDLTKQTKIIKLGDGYTIKSFPKETNSLYRLVYSNSEEGAKLGLSPDEFAIIYDVYSVDLKFTLPMKAEKDGVEYDYNLGFSIQDLGESDNSIIDSAGYVLLNKLPSALVIKGTSGDDLFIAGYGQDIYDGGSGSDSLSYERYNTGITVDFTNKDESNKILAQNGISSSNSAFVTTDKIQQVITNFNSIIGTSHNDTFIIGDSAISINGGDGDDKFIIKGGSFKVNGGEGCNSITFEQINNLGVLKDVQLTDQMNLQIDGVEINLSAGSINFNKDGALQSGVIQNINSVVGSSHNDIIIGSDKDDVIDGAGGKNIIYGSSGNDIIDGGKEGVLSYALMEQSIDVNLKTNEANKGTAGVDKLNNIGTVVGAAGGGSLSSDNINATFIGTGGITKFTVGNGSFSLFGGKDQNIYTIDSSIVTVTGKGNDTLTSIDSLLTYLGNASSHSVLDISGGQASITIGTGSSVVTAKNNGNITIHTGHGGDFVYHSINANAIFHLDEKTSTTLDYSESITSSGIFAHLSNGMIQGSNFNDKIVTGNISKLVGSQYGNNSINASGIKNNISLIGYKSNNTFIVGSGNSNYYEIINPEGNNNVLDYSALSDLIHVNLNNDIIYKNNNQNYDQVINFNHIIGSSASGNSFKGKNGVDTIFDIRQGSNQIIFGKDEGNDSYWLTSDRNNQLNYKELNSGIIFEQTGEGGNSQATVTKNNYKDIIYGQATEVTGTDLDDIFLIHGAIVSPQNIFGGKGNDKFVFYTIPNIKTNVDGGEGINSFVWARSGSGVSTFYLNKNNDDGSFGFQLNSQKYTTVNNISKLIFKGDSSAYLRWDNNVKNIDVLVESHNGNKTFEFLVSGGGNKIDGGYNVSKTAWSKVDYNNLKNGIEADLESGNVKYLDGSQNDILKNINMIRGTSYNDKITGSKLDTVFFASKGNDEYKGNGSNDEYRVSFQCELNLSQKTVNKLNNGMDKFDGIEEFYLSDSDDVIKFNANDDIGNIKINCGNGTDVLQQLSSGNTNIDLKDMSNLIGIDTINIKDVNHDNVSFDLDGFFKSHTDKQSLNLIISSTDANNRDSVFNITHNDSWRLDTQSANKFIYVDNANHQLIVDVV